jgi:hypothetical protein
LIIFIKNKYFMKQDIPILPHAEDGTLRHHQRRRKIVGCEILVGRGTSPLPAWPDLRAAVLGGPTKSLYIWASGQRETLVLKET